MKFWHCDIISLFQTSMHLPVCTIEYWCHHVHYWYVVFGHSFTFSIYFFFFLMLLLPFWWWIRITTIKISFIGTAFTFSTSVGDTLPAWEQYRTNWKIDGKHLGDNNWLTCPVSSLLYRCLYWSHFAAVVNSFKSAKYSIFSLHLVNLMRHIKPLVRHKCQVYKRYAVTNGSIIIFGKHKNETLKEIYNRRCAVR